jgi:hypothetical protein
MDEKSGVVEKLQNSVFKFCLCCISMSGYYLKPWYYLELEEHSPKGFLSI